MLPRIDRHRLPVEVRDERRTVEEDPDARVVVPLRIARPEDERRLRAFEIGQPPLAIVPHDRGARVARAQEHRGARRSVLPLVSQRLRLIRGGYARFLVVCRRGCRARRDQRQCERERQRQRDGVRPGPARKASHHRHCSL
jgi:hypothetical protein